MELATVEKTGRLETTVKPFQAEQPECFSEVRGAAGFSVK